MRAHPAAPKRVVLDFDSTDVPQHGMQAGRHWHGPYRSYRYLPLYVFAGRHLLAAALHRLDGGKVRLFDEFGYAARSWPRERRVVAKAEHTALGPNTRFVVTSLDVGDDPQGLYDGL